MRKTFFVNFSYNVNSMLNFHYLCVITNKIEDMKKVMMMIGIVLLMTSNLLAQAGIEKTGELFIFDNQPYTGDFNEYFEDGSQKTLSTIKNGKLEGRVVYFYGNGAKKEQGEYKNNQKDGNWTRWTAEGNRIATASYKNGVKDGKWFIWDENGKMRYQMVYDNGKKIDTWYMWDENENLISEKAF
jgi:antitoxin component YwqK of YwqJK toxin-antitoxin module